MQQEHECTLGLHLVSAQMQKKKKKEKKEEAEHATPP